MNILIRVERDDDKVMIENLLGGLFADLYFVRNDARMLAILQTCPMDAIVLGPCTQPQSVRARLKLLHCHFGLADIPILCCCGERYTVNGSWKAMTGDCAAGTCFSEEQSFGGRRLTIRIEQMLARCGILDAVAP